MLHRLRIIQKFYQNSRLVAITLSALTSICGRYDRPSGRTIERVKVRNNMFAL